MRASNFGFDVSITVQGFDLTPPDLALYLVVLKPDASGGTDIDRLIDAGDIHAGTVVWHVAEGDLDVAGDYRVLLSDRTEGRRVDSEPVIVTVEPPLYTP